MAGSSIGLSIINKLVFSKELMKRETDEFVNNCKAQVENMEKQDDNVKDEGTPNCELDDSSSSENDDITIDVDESIKKPEKFPNIKLTA